MPDDSVEILFKSAWDNRGTSSALGDIRLLVERANQGSKEAADALDRLRKAHIELRHELSAGPATNTGAGVASTIGPNLSTLIGGGRGVGTPRQIANALAVLAGQGGGGYTGPLPPVIAPPPVPTGQAGQGGAPAGLGYGMRRHLGAVAGQVLGMPGLGTALAAGGMAGGIGAAVIGLEKLIRLLNDLGAGMRKLEELGHAYGKVGDFVRTASENHRDLNRQSELFQLQLDHTRELINSTAASVQRLNTLREHEAELNIKLEDVNYLRERENILLNTRFNVLQRIQQLTDLDERIAQRTIQRQIEAEERKIKLAEDQKKIAEGAKKVAEGKAETDKDEISRVKEKAETVQEEQGIVQDTAKERYKLYDNERKALEMLMQGKSAGAAHYAMAAGAQALAGESGTQASWALRGVLADPATQAQFFAGHITPQLQSALQARYSEVRGVQRGLAGQANRAGETIDEAQQEKKILEADLKFQQSQIETETGNIEKAKRDAETSSKTLNQLKNAAPAIIQGEIEADETRKRREIYESLRGTGIPSGAGASTSGVEERLDRIYSLWAEGGSLV